MISFNYEGNFQLDNEAVFSGWISRIIASEAKKEGDINYVFCNDDYLHEINLKYLQHDDLTDIISFDYSLGDEIIGDIFISTERVADNAGDFMVSFDEELKRVMAHGLLHYCGYKDKTKQDATKMRQKEEEKIAMFHVEQQSD